MHIETIRVVNPNDPSRFMTINRSDMTPEHELWPEQAAEHDEPSRAADASETVVAMRMVAKFMAHKAGMPLVEWQALPATDRLAKMAEAEIEFDDAMVVGDTLPVAPRVAKGPRGRWYGFRGKERLTDGFDTAEEAQAALDNLEG